jgi:hypothetical protein
MDQTIFRSLPILDVRRRMTRKIRVPTGRQIDHQPAHRRAKDEGANGSPGEDFLQFNCPDIIATRASGHMDEGTTSVTHFRAVAVAHLARLKYPRLICRICGATAGIVLKIAPVEMALR